MIEYYNNMCIAHYHRGLYHAALYYQTKSYKIGEKLCPANNHFFLSFNLNNIGKCFYKQHKYKQAMEYFQQSLNIARKVLKQDDNYIDMGITISNIGKISYREKKYADALQQYDIVLKLLEKAGRTEHIDLAYTLKNIGEVYFDLLNFDLALTHLNQALTMYKKIFGKRKQRDIAKCLHLIGQVYYYRNADQYNDETCFEYFNQALDIWSDVLPNNHPDLALCYKSITLFYLNRKHDSIQASILQFHIVSTNQ